ncbi:MAG: hypothetical protein WCT04_23220 [Planctomycetota bacterium]
MQISRRTFLRAHGAALLLPFLLPDSTIVATTYTTYRKDDSS